MIPMRTRRHKNFACLLLCWLLVGCGDEPQERPGTEPRHVLLFTIEGLRADHVSSLGYFRPTTFGAPNDPSFVTKPGKDFDAVADQGVQFPNCFAPAGGVGRALESLHSGSLQNATGANLADAFKEAGFQTIACVAGQADGEASGFASGFDVFEEHARDNDAIARAWFHATAAIEDDDAPRVFIWIHLSEIGPPFVPAPLPKIITERELASYFGDAGYEGPVDGSLDFLERVQRGEVQLALADREQIVAGYDGQVARAAALMRAFLERWAFTVRDTSGAYVQTGGEAERWGQTLVVGCGVSGAELGEHGNFFGAANTLHDSSLRVPLFFSHPASLTGKRLLASLVELTDVAPTLIDWFGLSGLPEERGRSLLPLMDTYVQRPFEERASTTSLPEVGQTVRTERWRLIQRSEAIAPMLFDLNRDEHERRNVCEEHTGVVERLQAILETRE